MTLTASALAGEAITPYSRFRNNKAVGSRSGGDQRTRVARPLKLKTRAVDEEANSEKRAREAFVPALFLAQCQCEERQVCLGYGTLRSRMSSILR